MVNLSEKGTRRHRDNYLDTKASTIDIVSKQEVRATRELATDIQKLHEVVLWTVWRLAGVAYRAKWLECSRIAHVYRHNLSDQPGAVTIALSLVAGLLTCMRLGSWARARRFFEDEERLRSSEAALAEKMVL